MDNASLVWPPLKWISRWFYSKGIGDYLSPFNILFLRIYRSLLRADWHQTLFLFLQVDQLVEVKYPLCLFVSLLYSIKNCLKSISEIKVCKESHYVQPPNWHFSLSAKMNATQRKAHGEYIVHTTGWNDNAGIQLQYFIKQSGIS